MLRRLIFSLMLFSCSGYAQTREFGARYGIEYTPTDYFLQVSCLASSGKFQKNPFLGLGINRTFFQQRIYPEIGYQLAYIANQQQIRILPYAQISLTRLKITDDNAHYWLNNELGIRLESHKKHDFGIQFGYRNLNEFWMLNKNGYSSISYGFTTGIYFKP